MRRGEKHDTVHHNTECRKRIEVEMGKDEVLSKSLADIEERKKGFLAKQVEVSDRERVEAGEEATGSGTRTEPQPEAPVDAVAVSESSLCTWIECSHDKRTWAEVQEEEREGGGTITGPPSSPESCVMKEIASGATLHSRPPSGCGGRSQA